MTEAVLWRLAERPVRRLPGPVHAAEFLAAFHEHRPQPGEDTPLDPALEVPMHGAVIRLLAGQPIPLTAGPPTLDIRVQDGRRPEPRDFRHGDREVLLAEYAAERDRHTPRWKCTVKGVDVATQAVRSYVNERGVHNECEGVFPNQEYMCLESAVDSDADNPLPIDLWKLALDGSGRRVRMTRMCDHKPWRATNSNISPDGRWLAFMTNVQGDEAGYGRGLGLMDLAAWEASCESRHWEIAPVLDED